MMQVSTSLNATLALSAAGRVTTTPARVACCMMRGQR